LNADKLTTDAQSALRRCIEVFSHSTRFFIVVEDKEHLLKPIISRFCEFFISIPNIIKYENLNCLKIQETYPFNEDLIKEKKAFIKKILNENTYKNLFKNIEKLYNKGICGLDIVNFIKYNFKTMDETSKSCFLFNFHKIKKEFRNEKIIILFILNYFLRFKLHLENIEYY
jgi:DNA polymerase III delta prime subunit